MHHTPVSVCVNVVKTQQSKELQQQCVIDEVAKIFTRMPQTGARKLYEHIIQFALEDWWITDPQAYHNQTKATLTVDCLEDTKVLIISLADREKLCQDLRKMEYFSEKNYDRLYYPTKTDFMFHQQYRNGTLH